MTYSTPCDILYQGGVSMRTMKQIAEAIGVDKQRVYRFVKKHKISETSKSDDGSLLYDEAAETRIIRGITENSEAHRSTSEAHRSASDEAGSDTVVNELIIMLKDELSSKNKLIDEQQQTIKELNETIKIQAQSINAVHHNELAETIVDGQKLLSSAAPDKPSLWSKIFKNKK